MSKPSTTRIYKEFFQLSTKGNYDPTIRCSEISLVNRNVEEVFIIIGNIEISGKDRKAIVQILGFLFIFYGEKFLTTGLYILFCLIIIRETYYFLTKPNLKNRFYNRDNGGCKVYLCVNRRDL